MALLSHGHDDWRIWAHIQQRLEDDREDQANIWSIFLNHTWVSQGSSASLIFT